MIAQATQQSKPVLHRAGGRAPEKITIAHQFNNSRPYEVSLPSNLSLSAGKARLQGWVDRNYPKHVVVM